MSFEKCPNCGHTDKPVVNTAFSHQASTYVRKDNPKELSVFGSEEPELTVTPTTGVDKDKSITWVRKDVYEKGLKQGNKPALVITEIKSSTPATALAGNPLTGGINIGGNNPFDLNS